MGWFSRKQRTGGSGEDVSPPEAAATTLEPTDDQLLDVLARSGDLDRSRDWIQFLSFPDEAAARRALDQAVANGWAPYGGVNAPEVTAGSPEGTAGSPEDATGSAEGSADWSVSIRRDDLPVRADTVSAARIFFTRLAAEGAGIYDGWEAAADEEPLQPPQQPQRQPLDEADTAWLMSLWEEAARIGIDHSPGALEMFLSHRRAEWSALPESERTDPHPIIALTAAVAGRMIAEATGLEWTLVTSQDGDELALTPVDGPDIGVFPLDVVARIWHGESRSSVADFIVTASRQISAALSEPGEG